MKVFIQIHGSNPESDYMLFDLDTMKSETKLDGVVNQQPTNYKEVGVVLLAIGAEFMKKETEND